MISIYINGKDIRVSIYVSVNKYTLHRNDRNRHGGGVALYIRDDIKHKARNDLSMEGIESLWVEISKGINNEPLLICSMCRPPSASHEYFDTMVENIELASSTNMQMIILGDLNFNYQIDESLSSNPIHLIKIYSKCRKLLKNRRGKRLPRPRC